jgi:hypothetical protein
VPLTALDDEDVVERALIAIGLRLDGKAAAATMARRKRAVFYNVAPETPRSAGMDGQAEPSPDAATATPAPAIAMARRCQAGRRPADPVNEIVTSETAASQRQLRRRRRR